MLVVPTFDASAAHFIVCKPRKYLLTARLVLEQRLFFVRSIPLAVVGRLAGLAVRALGACTANGTLLHCPTPLSIYRYRRYHQTATAATTTRPDTATA